MDLHRAPPTLGARVGLAAASWGRSGGSQAAAKERRVRGGKRGSSQFLRDMQCNLFLQPPSTATLNDSICKPRPCSALLQLMPSIMGPRCGKHNDTSRVLGWNIPLTRFWGFLCS